VNAAVRAGVSFWPIDARGLVAQAPLGDATRQSPGGIGMFNGGLAGTAMTNFQRSQDTLYALAKDTGGTAMFGTGIELRREQADYKPSNIAMGIGDNIAGDSAAERPFDVSRKMYGMFGELQVPFSKGLEATGSLRYDHYSDFGGTLNPRASLVWNASAQSVFKLLYGRAFRPPTIFETHSNGTYAPSGNRNLKPVTLDMLELALNQRSSRGTWGASVFGYQQTHLVQTTPDPAAPSLLAYINQASKDRSWGTQLTGEFQITQQWAIQSHYTFQRHTTESGHDPNIAQAPRHQLYAEVKWHATSNWSAGLRGLYVAGRERAANDPRPDPKNYLVAGLSAERRNIFDRVDLGLLVNNLFNTIYTYPSGSATVLPYDIPAPGRLWYLSLVVHL